jgi:hypothetical protein
MKPRFRASKWLARAAFCCAATAACAATKRSPAGDEIDCSECDADANAGESGCSESGCSDGPASCAGNGGDANVDAAGRADGPGDDAPAWCDVRVVLERKCQRCHSDPPANGAPFALVTYEDTQVIDRGGVPRSKRMADAIVSDYMPPRFLKIEPPVDVLTAEEKELLLEWLFSGAASTGGPQCGD